MQDNSMDNWMECLINTGWTSSKPSVFIAQGCWDALPLPVVESIVQTIVQETAVGGALLFDTVRQMDERRRMTDWLHHFGIEQFLLEELQSKSVHQGILSIHDPDFVNRWLVFCQL